MRKVILALTLTIVLGQYSDSLADTSRWKASTFVIEATVASGGVQYHRRLIASLRIGLGIAAGPIQGVKVNRTASRTFDDAREVASAGLLVGYRFHKNFAIEASPLRISIFSGNDYSQFYPSGHLKAFLVFPDGSSPRFGVGTQLTLVRVAGLNSF